MNNLKSQLRATFQAVFESNDFNPQVISQYFDQAYIQVVDGKELNYDQFIDHIRTLKKNLFNVRIDFKHLIEEQDQVASVHFASGTKSNGAHVKAQVIAYFQFKGNKIIYCNELTRMIIGEQGDEDLGSRH